MRKKAGLSFTTCIPDGIGLIFVAIFHALVYVSLGVAARHKDLSEQSDVRYGQPQSVDLGQPLLVGECWHMTAQLLERRVDAEHALALADVGSMTLDAVWVVLKLVLVLMLVMMLVMCVMVGGKAAWPELTPLLLFLLCLCSPAVQLSLWGVRLQLWESKLCFGEPRLTPDGGPWRKFICHCCAIKQKGVKL